MSAKALKYWQAVVVASIFEFLGAILLGANNTGKGARESAAAPQYQDSQMLLICRCFAFKLASLVH